METYISHPSPRILNRSNIIQNTQRVDKEHELEIELSSTMLIKQGRRAQAGEPHMYTELVDGFIDNVRLLARRTLQGD